MRIWLTGCNGMLAQAFVRQLKAARIDYVGSDIEVDLTSESEVKSFCRNEAFTHIVNAAAYTRVDDAETDSAKAFALNVTAVRFLTQAAEEARAVFIHFSTDYVFSGTANEPYLETAEPAPVTAYGKSKLDGERWALGAMARAISRVYVVRTSWLFGHEGNNFVRTMLKAMMVKDELRVVDDQRGRPTYTEDLASCAVALAGIDGRVPSNSGLFHFANRGAVSWYEFALVIAEVARSKGLSLKVSRILPVSSAEYTRPAPRPLYSVLDTGKVEEALSVAPRDFRTTVADYLDVLIPSIQ